MKDGTHRKLTSILFADVVGYTAMMENSEAEALVHLEHFKSTLEKYVSVYDGEIIQYYGDGCLIVFNHTENALGFAATVQKDFQQLYQLPVRMGLNRGTAVFKAGNVFGEAVNLASRIETIAASGGVMFSKKIQEDISSPTDFPSQSLGKFQFKNVKKPVEVFGLALPGFPILTRQDILKTSKVIVHNNTSTKQRSIILLTSMLVSTLLYFIVLKPSSSYVSLLDVDKTIAVLPFKNLDQSKKSELLGLGIFESLSKDLAKTKALRVSTRNKVNQYRDSTLSHTALSEALGVNFMLENNIQQNGDEFEIHSELIQFPDEIIWTKNYHKPVGLESILEIQQDIFKNVTTYLQVPLDDEILEQIERAPTNSYEAYESYLQGTKVIQGYYNHKSIAALDSAIRFYRTAVELDDQFAEGYISLAYGFWLKNFDHSYFERNFMDSALLLTDQALAINPFLAEGYAIRGNYYFNQSKFELAEQNYRRGLELQPNQIYCLTDLGFLTYFINGNYVEGLEFFQRVSSIEQVDNLQDIFEKIAMLYLDIGEFEKSEDYFRRAKEVNPRSGGLAWAYQAQGKYREFRDFTNELLDSFPDMTYMMPSVALGYMHTREYEKSLAVWKPIMANLETQGKDHYQNRLRNKYGFVLYQSGQKKEGRHQVELCNEYLLRSIQMGRILATGGSAQYDLASNYAFLGEKEKAYEWLEKFGKYGWRWGSIHFIQVDPFFEKLREEKRFQEMVAGVLDEKSLVREEISEGSLVK